MTDAHFHREGFATFMRSSDGSEIRFLGTHPWQAGENGPDLDGMRRALQDDATAGVGEIGLDRLKSKTVTERQRDIFAQQLEIAAGFHRPAVLHGAKCWGEVVAACRPYKDRIPAFLFHGFSRSAGLLPDILALNGYISAGPALLNGHAVNYRALVKELPLERTLLETDMDYSLDPEGAAKTIHDLHLEFARLRGLSPDDLEGLLAGNMRRFLSGTP